MKIIILIFAILFSFTLFANEEIESLIKTDSFVDTLINGIENELNRDLDFKIINIEDIINIELLGIQNDNENSPYAFDVSVEAVSKKFTVECEVAFIYDNPNWKYDLANCKVNE